MTILIICRDNPNAPQSATNLANNLLAEHGIAAVGRSFRVRAQVEGDDTGKIARDGFLAAFSEISDSIEGLMETDGAFGRRRTVLVEDDGAAGGDAFFKDFVATNYTAWRHLCALLVMTFPDILWVFGTGEDIRAAFQARGFGLHAVTGKDIGQALADLIYLRDIGFEPLFDPTGLRAFVKERSYEAIETMFRKENGKIVCARRSQLAIVIDDEAEVAAGLSYVHYKRGYRVQTVTSEALLKRDLPLPSPSRSAESYTIAFPDSDRPTLRSGPQDIDSQCPALTTLVAKQRIVFTIDDHKPKEPHSTGDANHVLLNAPFEGFAGLSASFGLDSAPQDFDWPPRHVERGHVPGRHAVPGFMVSAARRLLNRLDIHPEAPAHVRCMFALEAQELLLNRLPSLSLLAQQARMASEIRLEMQLPTIFGRSDGSAASDLKPRFAEVEAECASILSVVYMQSAKRKERLLRLFQSQLVGVMIDEFRRSYHFHEEISSLRKQRELDLSGNLFGRYTAFILSGPRCFIASVAIWITAFGFAYMVLFWAATGDLAVLGPLLTSAYTFASVGAAPDAMAIGGNASGAFVRSYNIAVVLECLVALFHWGTGLAHLYTLLSRR
jgi:hypothetical protein